MNQHDDLFPFDDAGHEREWLAQEEAIRRERLHLDATGNDIRDRHYRLLARALRESSQDGLPPDFATRVAIRANAAVASSARFELALLIILLVIMVVIAGTIMMIHGGEWISLLGTVLTAPNANSWLVAFAICLGASWVVERCQHRIRK